MDCPNCNKKVSPEWISCPYCNYQPRKCSNPSCGSIWLPDDALFCPQCGNPLESNSHATSLRKGRFKIEKEKCIGCAKCVKQCPDDKIVLTEYVAPGHKLASFNICNCFNYECSSCYNSCNFQAITIDYYYYIQRGFNNISEQNRHAIYEHYISQYVDNTVRYEQLVNQRTLGISLFSSIFEITSKALIILLGMILTQCLEEMYNFHMYMEYKQFDKSREDFLLAEWIIDNAKVSPLILTKIVSQYNESNKESLAHFIYETRIKTGLI